MTTAYYSDRYTVAMQDARALLALGFATKAAQKRAIDQVSMALDCVKRCVQNVYLQIPHDERTEAQGIIYFQFPMYPHQLKALPMVSKIAVSLPAANKYAALLPEVQEVYEAIKGAELDPTAPGRTHISRSAGHAEADAVQVVGARFRNQGGVLVVTLPDGRQVKRVTIRPYKWVSIAERKGRSGELELFIRHASTVGIDTIRNEIARETRYRRAPLMIATSAQ